MNSEDEKCVFERRFRETGHQNKKSRTLGEPLVYQEIKNGREWLTSVISPLMADGMLFITEKDKIIKNSTLSKDEKQQQLLRLSEECKPLELSYLEKLISLATLPQTAEKVLTALFPNLTFLFEQRRKPSDFVMGAGISGIQWDRELRFCSPRRFDRYFSGAVSRSKLKQDERNILVRDRGNQAELLATVRQYARNGKTDDVIDELQAISDSTLAQHEIESFITVIMNWGDEIFISNWRTTTFPERIVRLCGIVVRALKRCPNLVEAIAIFESACSNTSGFYVALLCATKNLAVGGSGMEIYFVLEFYRDEIAPEDREQLFKRLTTQIGNVKQKLWQKFDELVAGRTQELAPLEERSVFGPLLWLWIFRDSLKADASPEPTKNEAQSESTWPSHDAARGWVNELISAPRGYAQFAQMSASTYTNIWGDDPPFPNSSQSFNTDVIRELSDVLILEQRGEQLDFSSLSDRERRWALALLDATRSKLQRQSEEGKSYTLVNKPNLF